MTYSTKYLYLVLYCVYNCPVALEWVLDYYPSMAPLYVQYQIRDNGIYNISNINQQCSQAQRVLDDGTTIQIRAWYHQCNTTFFFKKKLKQ
jgi:hypothetical protein